MQNELNQIRQGADYENYKQAIEAAEDAVRDGFGKDGNIDIQETITIDGKRNEQAETMFVETVKRNL
jgi:hypothetical protein